MLQEPCSFNTVLDAPVDACGLGHDVWGLLMAEHVLGAALPSSDIVSGPVETLTGAPVKLAVSDAGAITVNDTNVTGADMAPSNGIVHHVINTVMLPRTATNPTAAVAAATTAAPVDPTDAVAVDPTEAAPAEPVMSLPATVVVDPLAAL